MKTVQWWIEEFGGPFAQMASLAVNAAVMICLFVLFRSQLRNHRMSMTFCKFAYSVIAAVSFLAIATFGFDVIASIIIPHFDRLAYGHVSILHFIWHLLLVGPLAIILVKDIK